MESRVQGTVVAVLVVVSAGVGCLSQEPSGTSGPAEATCPPENPPEPAWTLSGDRLDGRQEGRQVDRLTTSGERVQARVAVDPISTLRVVDLDPDTGDVEATVARPTEATFELHDVGLGPGGPRVVAFEAADRDNTFRVQGIEPGSANQSWETTWSADPPGRLDTASLAALAPDRTQDRAFLAAVSSDRSGAQVFLGALDAGTGEEVWTETFDVDGETVWVSELAVAPDGQQVAVAARGHDVQEARLHVFDAATGTTAWSQRIPVDAPWTDVTDAVYGPEGDRLVLASRTDNGASRLAILEAATGEPVQVHEIEGGLHNTDHAFDALTATDERVFLHTSGGPAPGEYVSHLQAFDLEDGEHAWTADAAPECGGLSGSADLEVGSEGLLYVAYLGEGTQSGSEGYYADRTAVAAYDPADGEQVWRTSYEAEAPTELRSIEVVDGALVAAGVTGTMEDHAPVVVGYPTPDG